MPSSQSSSHSPGEEAYYTAEEDQCYHAQSSSGASSIVTATPNGSVYATAIQTPVASPSMNRDTASSVPIVAQDQRSYQEVRSIEESLEERREETTSNVTAAPSGSLFTHRAEASTYLERQRELFMQQAELRESEKGEDAPNSPTREALDGSSQIWATGPPTWVNEGRPTGPAGTPEDTHQGLAPIEEDEMPYDLFGNFIMNPEAPVFVPRQPPMAARDLRDLMHEGVTEPEGDQSPEAPPNTPNASPLTQQVPLYGAAHGMFFDPTTGMFTGDGPPRESPHRPDGTLPSQPDRQSDFLTRLHYPRDAEDQLHIQPRSEYNERMADFGKNGPIEPFRIARPVPQGSPQQATRVMFEREGGESMPFGRGMSAADDDSEVGLYMPGRRGNIAEEVGAELSRLTARISRGEPVEREFRADAREAEEEEEERTVPQHRPVDERLLSSLRSLEQ